MTLLPEALMAEQILYSENVIALRQGIALKYPQASSKERADLLSKAIKRILHKHLSSLEENIQNDLIHELLKTAVQKQDFSINAHDVVSSYASLEAAKEDGLAPLATWLNEATGHTLSPEEMVATFSFLKPLYVSPPVVTSKDRLDTSSKLHSLAIDVPSALVQPASADKPMALNLTQVINKDAPSKKVIRIVSTFCIAASTVLLMTSIQAVSKDKSLPLAPPTPTPSASEMPLTFLIPEESYLVTHLQYKAIDEVALNKWLTNRNSLLAEEPYFSTILKAAASYNINPLLMFAITGQEQGFVPKTHERAVEIANNPFNVYGSWQDFNTDIEDTAFIAARTIINLSKGCPSDADPIKWLNQKYAEDPNWHTGVTYFLEVLEENNQEVATKWPTEIE